MSEERIIDGCQNEDPAPVQTHEEREQVMKEILADWSSVADTGAMNIIRGTE